MLGDGERSDCAWGNLLVEGGMLEAKLSRTRLALSGAIVPVPSYLQSIWEA